MLSVLSVIPGPRRSLNVRCHLPGLTMAALSGQDRLYLLIGNTYW